MGARNGRTIQKLVLDPLAQKVLTGEFKEGDTVDKRDRFRALLKESGYRVGHVTIDASDWYVNERMGDRLAKQPKASIGPYQDYLIAHLLDRAASELTVGRALRDPEQKLAGRPLLLAAGRRPQRRAAHRRRSKSSRSTAGLSPRS